jgi:3-hydroxyacyl-CoA dehydrogenase
MDLNGVFKTFYSEALHLIERGVATPDDIDQVMINSLGPRYAMIGPLEYMDYDAECESWWDCAWEYNCGHPGKISSRATDDVRDV